MESYKLDDQAGKPELKISISWMLVLVLGIILLNLGKNLLV
jgi:hypothetical protein